MSGHHKLSGISPPPLPTKKYRINWHEAISCAIQIELYEYKHLLEFQTEYLLGKNYYRIDMLIIKKLTSKLVPKNFANIFGIYNLFEIKGAGSSVSINSYYKTIGYAGILISQTSTPTQYSAHDISLSLLSLHYPKKLFAHLKGRKLTVRKYSPGIYHIFQETFRTQIIVISQLLPENNLYLHCLTGSLADGNLTRQLISNYEKHKDQHIYIKYMNQLTTILYKKKGGIPMEKPMICEGIFTLFGTSSDEIIERTKKEDADYYLPQIDKLTLANKQLSTQINYLKSLLESNSIPFNPDFVPSSGQRP